MILTSSSTQDMLNLPGAPTIWVDRAFFLLAAMFGSWLVFDTRRALKVIVTFAARRPSLARWLSFNPQNLGWIWFYRIDGALVLVGVVLIFAQDYFAR